MEGDPRALVLSSSRKKELTPRFNTKQKENIMKKLSQIATVLAIVVGLNAPVVSAADENQHSHQAEKKEVMIHAVVNSINSTDRMVNISHGPIKDLSWPAMTMDMKVAQNVDMDVFHKGEEIMVSLSRDGKGIFEIVKVMVHGH